MKESESESGNIKKSESWFPDLSATNVLIIAGIAIGAVNLNKLFYSAKSVVNEFKSQNREENKVKEV